MSQQSLWKEGAILPVGKMGGEKLKEQGLVKTGSDQVLHAPTPNIHCLMCFKVVFTLCTERLHRLLVCPGT